MANESTFDVALRRTLLVLVAALLVLMCYAMFRMTMVIYRVEQTVVSVNQKIDEMTARVKRLEERSGRAIGVDDLGATLGRMGDLREDFDRPGSLSPADAEAIRHLISRLRTSGCTFEAAGDSDSALGFFARCLAKYQTWERSLRSPEDFIDKLASKSMAGDDYAIVHPDGRREPLALWLHAALAEYRASRGAATQPE